MATQQVTPARNQGEEWTEACILSLTHNSHSPHGSQPMGEGGS